MGKKDQKIDPRSEVGTIVHSLLDTNTREAGTILSHMVKGAMESGTLDDVPAGLVLWYLNNRVLWLIEGEMRGADRDDRWAMAGDITMLMSYISRHERWAEPANVEMAIQTKTVCHRFLVQRRAWDEVAREDLSYGGAIPSPAAKAVKTALELAPRSGA